MADDTEALEPGACGDSAIITDTGLSTFVGGDLTYKNISEVEGSVVVDGNVNNAIGMLAGHVMWGMGVDPAWNTDALIQLVVTYKSVTRGSPVSTARLRWGYWIYQNRWNRADERQ